MRKIYLMLASIFLLTGSVSHADTNKQISYVPADILTKEGLVHLKSDNKLFSGKIIIQEGEKPSFLDVKDGVINHLFIVNKNITSNYIFKNKLKHIVDIKGDDKPMDITYNKGVLSTLKMASPDVNINATFDENSNVTDFKGIYDKNDLMITFKDQVITYTKPSSQQELRRLEPKDIKYSSAYAKLNAMLRRVDASTMSYESVLRMLQISVKPKKVKISLEKCQEMLGDKEYTRIKELLEEGPALSYYCNKQANKK